MKSRRPPRADECYNCGAPDRGEPGPCFYCGVKCGNPSGYLLRLHDKPSRIELVADLVRYGLCSANAAVEYLDLPQLKPRH